MKCSKCEKILPDDSEFCQYCGDKVQVECVNDEASRNINSTEKHARIRIQNVLAKIIGTVIGIVSIKQYFRFNKYVSIFIIALIIILAGVNIFQFINNMNLNNKKDSTISKQQSSISVLNSNITELKKQINDYSTDSKAFDTICDFLNSGNAGYASKNFKSSESIIVLSKSTTRKSFNLTTNLGSHATIGLDLSGLSANVEFSESSWYGSTTTMYVTPNFEGTTIATFSNNLNTQTFRVLIIVTD